MSDTETQTTETQTMTTINVAILSGRPDPTNFLALESGTERSENGVLTTDHPASSYGLPVVVLADGAALGIADRDNMRLVPRPSRSDDADGNEIATYPEGAQQLVDAARRAGYSVRDCG